MRMLVYGTDGSWEELTAASNGIEWTRAEDENAFLNARGHDAYFNLHEDAWQMNYAGLEKPVFINSVSNTLQQCNGTKGKLLRINGWHGFLKRDAWEMAGVITDEVKQIAGALQKKLVNVPDEPGFIAARILAMIINEAYFAKQEGVSTGNEIDTAMKLGTNYPLGPFEWAANIGLMRVHELLSSLQTGDARYKPCELLALEAMRTV